ncbi:MAG: insulinase family protein, partial [Tannerella sp.]|nr:insulinase family protein [Tannerella sp.]
KLSNYALRAAKKQAIGQTVVASDNNENVFISLGKAYLHTNRYETLPEIIARIESVTASQILTVANEILSPPTLSTLTYS